VLIDIRMVVEGFPFDVDLRDVVAILGQRALCLPGGGIAQWCIRFHDGVSAERGRACCRCCRWGG
jgi:hypothetical protein